MDEPILELVHRDGRGDIYRVAIPPDREIMIFRCRAGFLRGGHSHTCPEIVSVLSGRMRYHKTVDGVATVEERGPGDAWANLPGEPHMGEFLEESWVVEWKYGPDAGEGRWTTVDHAPYRDLIEAGRHG